MRHDVPRRELERLESRGRAAARANARRLPARRALAPDGGEENANDGYVAVDRDDDRPVEEVGVAEDDDELCDVEEDGEDEVGDDNVEERLEALRPRVCKGVSSCWWG